MNVEDESDDDDEIEFMDLDEIFLSNRIPCIEHAIMNNLKFNISNVEEY